MKLGDGAEEGSIHIMHGRKFESAIRQIQSLIPLLPLHGYVRKAEVRRPVIRIHTGSLRTRASGFLDAVPRFQNLSQQDPRGCISRVFLKRFAQEYPRYAAAWVLLGQVLEAGNRIEEARGACSQASGVDSDYGPAYLCLADVAVQRQEWNQALDLADRALKLSPVHDVYGSFFSA